MIPPAVTGRLIESAAVGSHGRRPFRTLVLAVVLVAAGAASRAPAGVGAQTLRDARVEAPLPSVALELRPLFSQRRPILDVLATDDRRYVLDAAGLTIHIREQDAWRPQQSWPLTPAAPWPRDLRGMLAFNVDTVEAYLPHLRCSPPPQGTMLLCVSGALSFEMPPFDGRIELRRNLFVIGDLEVYSIVPLGPVAVTGAQYLAGTRDGFLTLLDADRRPLTRVMPGDDLAQVAGGCVREPHIVARLAGEDGDMLGVYQVRDRKMVPAAPPRLVQGRVTALWSRNGTARMIVRANDPERYEAYQISLACVR